MSIFENLLLTGNEERFIKIWNKKLKKRIVCDSSFNYAVNSEEFFMEYLRKIKWKKSVSFDENTIIIIENGKNMQLYYFKKEEFYYEEISIYSKKKWMNVIFQFTNIITNFPIDLTQWPKNKKYLRYELIRNYYTGSTSHCFSSYNLCPIDNYHCLLESTLVNEIFNRRLKIGSLLNFTSMMLNYLESGVELESTILRPKITVSNYGRWYFSGSDNIQNSKRARKYINDKILSTGKSIIKMDLKSAEPTCLAKFTGSKVLPFLIQKRYENPELSDMIKFVLNSFIHSGNDPEIIFEMVQHKFGVKYTSKNFNDLQENLTSLQTEILWYNRKVGREYSTKLHIHEGLRRIVNPYICLLNYQDYEKDIWKEHLKYLQGHVHDQIVQVAFQMKNLCGLMPSYLVHDELVYVGDEKVVDYLNETLLKLKMVGTITMVNDREEI